MSQKNNGITLIALVITIIVLLILAGVSIATLTGDNGILTKATDAKKDNEIASVKEQAQLDIANYVAEKLKNGEDSTVNTPEKIQQILDETNMEKNKYYAGYTDTGVTTPSGFEVPYEELYITNSNEDTTSKTIKDLVAGEKVFYDTGKDGVGTIECIVLYDSNSEYGIQIISADIVDTVTLGNSDFQQSKNSYNNALKTLYDKAQEYLNPIYASEARCVGSNPGDPDWDTTTNESGYYTKTEGESAYYEYMKSYYGTLKNEDDNYNIDWTQMGTIPGIKSASKNYCLASRDVDSNSSTSNFYVRGSNTSGNLIFGSLNLCGVFSSGGKGYSGSRGFRPVFTLKSGIKITDGDGETTPYTLVP